MDNLDFYLLEGFKDSLEKDAAAMTVAKKGTDAVVKALKSSKAGFNLGKNKAPGIVLKDNSKAHAIGKFVGKYEKPISIGASSTVGFGLANSIMNKK